MKLWAHVLVLGVAASGTALAQPADPAAAEAPIADPPQPPPEPAPTTRAMPAPMPPAPETGDRFRPSELSIAIGIGYALPTSIQTPNISSVRLRLPSGLTFEPTVVLASASREVDTGATIKDSASEIGAAVLARFPVARHGRVDLEILGGLGFNSASTKPDAADMDVTVSTITATYGVAVTTWINRHWQISVTGLNPLFSNAKREEELGPGTKTVTSTNTFGLVFDPNVFVMAHLYH
ncbi:MAG: hypothetical protein ACTHU0_35965 [Kofleriaceae bacterium]